MGGAVSPVDGDLWGVMLDLVRDGTPIGRKASLLTYHGSLSLGQRAACELLIFGENEASLCLFVMTALTAR